MANDNEFGDVYSPDAMALRVELAGVTKIRAWVTKTFVLAMLAGAFIAFGAVFYSLVVTNSSLGFGITRFVGGLAFSLGLILVVVGGAELFTGNNLLVMAWVSRKISLAAMLKNWVIVYGGNFLGALGVVFLIYLSGLWSNQENAIGLTTLTIAAHKVNLGFWQAVSLGVLCNILVCLAVWLCYAGRSLTDKVLAILFPISAFVALGFEHSVANMYVIPAGIVLAEQPELVSQWMQANGAEMGLKQLTISDFLLGNLLPVTIGNLIGGGVLVALVYWFVYLRPNKFMVLRRLINMCPPKVEPNTVLLWMAEKMEAEHLDYLLVGTGDQLQGIVTASDMTASLGDSDVDPLTRSAKSIMSSPLITADVHCSIEHIQKQMKTHQIGHLVITDGEEYVGVISTKDMAESLSFT